MTNLPPSQAALIDMLNQARGEYTRLGRLATILLCLHTLVGFGTLVLVVCSDLTTRQRLTLSVIGAFCLIGVVLAAIALLSESPRSSYSSSETDTPGRIGNMRQMDINLQAHAHMLHNLTEHTNGYINNRRLYLWVSAIALFVPMAAVPLQTLLP